MLLIRGKNRELSDLVDMGFMLGSSFLIIEFRS